MSITKVCLHCQSTFIPKRSDAKFCSSKCRLDAFKERQDSEPKQETSHAPVHEVRHSRFESPNLEGVKMEDRPSSHKVPKQIEDLYEENGIFPYRYPRHYYTPYGRLTAAGWRGIDPMDREALKYKDLFSTDYQWLETQVSSEGQILNIYAGLIDDFFPKEEPTPEPKKEDGSAGWTSRESMAVDRYAEKARMLVDTFQEWIDEEEVSVSNMEKVVKGMRRYLKSQTYLDLPADCPAGYWIEEMESSISRYFDDLAEEVEWVDMSFSQGWEEEFFEVLDELDEYDESKE